MTQHRRHVQFQAPAVPPTIELDPEVMSWYVRFSSAKIAKTISEDDAEGVVCVIDLDDRNQVIGFELLGVRELSITMLLKNPFIDLSKTDLQRATFSAVPRGHLVSA